MKTSIMYHGVQQEVNLDGEVHLEVVHKDEVDDLKGQGRYP